MKKVIFTVNLYNYLDEEKAKICKEYQDHNEELIKSNGSFEYRQIDIDPELDELMSSPEYITGSLPAKYKYQLISDAVRYKFMKENPNSVFLDTDLCIFGKSGIDLLKRLSDYSENVTGVDYLSGEINKNRLFPCNWLMIGSGRKDNIFKDMYDMLLERLETYNYESYESTGKWSTRLEDYIWNELWGYAIPMKLDIKKFGIIPYEYFQAYSWNGNWKDADVMKKSHLFGCHFFGFAESRPRWSEFLEYHNINEYAKEN